MQVFAPGGDSGWLVTSRSLLGLSSPSVYAK